MFYKRMLSNSLGVMLGLLFLICLLVDSHYKWMKPLRAQIYTVINPLVEMKVLLKKKQDDFGFYLKGTPALRAKIEQQEQEITRLKTQQALYPVLQEENQNLRTLLKVSQGLGYRVKMARVVQHLQKDGMQAVMVDKGRLHHLQVGQGVMNESGVVGQISEVSGLSSRLILITDLNHALLAENHRNAEVLILEGTGQDDMLVAHDVPKTADFQIGDLLVSNRYLKRFFTHYPVATITKIENEGLSSVVYAKPVVNLSALHFVMVNMESQDDQE